MSPGSTRITTEIDRSVRLRKVIVTGGASGIGRAISDAFVAEGAEVFVGDASRQHVEAMTDAAPGLRAAVCDVGDPESVAGFFRAVNDAWTGRLDVLINNAGIAGPDAPIDRIEWADWERTLRVNVGGMLLCIQEATRMMRRQDGGAIINISSSSARTGLPNRLPYVVSKAAVHGLTLNVARELGPHNISCNAVLPGAVVNARGRQLIERYANEHGVSYDEALSANLRYISMRTEIEPAEVAALCMHLASPTGRHISGQLIGVCGNAEWEE